MKCVLTSTLCLFILGSVEAASFHISKMDLGSPYYRSVSTLLMQSKENLVGSGSIKFISKKNILLEIKNNIRIKRSDYSSCTANSCIINFYELPLSLEKYTCSIEVNFLSYSIKEKWGDCQTPPPAPDPKYLADLTFIEESSFSSNGEVEMTNIGNHLEKRNVEVWGFLKNQNNEIIWSGIHKVNATIRAGDSYLIRFSNIPKEWQNRLACSGVFYISPQFDFFERSKTNNKLEVEYGDCEDVPDVSRGDRIDFLPDAKIINGHLLLNVTNSGRLPFLDLTTSLESSIHYINEEGKVFFKKRLFTSSPIYGFNDSKTILEEEIPTEACSLEIEVNPNLIISESNYINNRIQIQICE